MLIVFNCIQFYVILFRSNEKIEQNTQSTWNNSIIFIDTIDIVNDFSH